MSRLRVLVVDDDPIEVRLLEATLSTLSDPAFEVAHATSMSAALAHLEAHGADVVLLDLTLPDSAEAATVVRLRAAHPGLPCVAHSARDELPFAAEVIRSGADDYLVKGEADERGLVRALLFAVARRAR